MATKNLNTRIVNKHDIEANWLNCKTPPYKGEIIIYDIEVDENGNILELPEGRTTPYTYERLKIGDGKNLVKDLPFCTDVSNILGYTPPKAVEVINGVTYSVESISFEISADGTVLNIKTSNTAS